MDPEPFLVATLRHLRSEVNERWPDRDKRSDGWLGDEAHSQRSSDHNPDSHGAVRALDIDVTGIQPCLLVVAMTHHPATHYVIYHGVLYSRRREFAGIAYTGADPHLSHIHVSTVDLRAADNARRRWLS
jgi:hypothetical protein